jgi:tRNA G18 (ribose-2'-O)-methylase SpoU
MNNIGSIFRSSDCFGVEKLYLCGISGTPPHREIHKTALGAENSVPWTYAESTLEVCKNLKDQGYKIMAIEQVENSTPLGSFKLEKDQPYALVLGNEVDGVSQEVLDLCDICIEIPQYGTKHSFNVSVCAGIVLWELLNK